jgi:TRAP-type C4-dicarboxylate transport system permease large subunit
MGECVVILGLILQVEMSFSSLCQLMIYAIKRANVCMFIHTCAHIWKVYINFIFIRKFKIRLYFVFSHIP